VPNLAHGIEAAEIDRQIQLLIRNLVEIKDTSGEFLLRLPDGRVIDTKGWNDWEWTHGVGLYGIYKYYQMTRDARCREIMLNWFRDRFAAGTPTKNINTVAPFLTIPTNPGCPISMSGRSGSWTGCRAPKKWAFSTSCSIPKIASSSGTTR